MGWRLMPVTMLMSVTMALIGLLSAAPANAATADAEVRAERLPTASTSETTAPVCRIGKPSYCLKYGGSRCEASNTAPDVKAACAAWTRGCFECHGVGDACKAGRGFKSGDAGCAECQETFVQCLYRMDSKFWPGRMR